MARIYTKTGDAGTTSLVGGTRVSKSSVRLDAYGTADELNSHIGVLLALPSLPPDIRPMLRQIQHRLFNLGAQLATEPQSPYQPQGITTQDIIQIEAEIDRIDALLPRHDRFILPGGNIASAQANVARTVARRCERHMVRMLDAGIAVHPDAMRYINRLSDYLFIVSRYINISSGTDEIFWEKTC